MKRGNVTSSIVKWSQKLKSTIALQAVKSGFMMLIPLVLLHSFILIILQFPLPAYQQFLHSGLAATVRIMAEKFNAAVFDYFSCYLTIAISWFYEKLSVGEKRTKRILPFVSASCFLIAIGAFTDNFDMKYMGLQGGFSAVFVSLLVAKFYVWFSNLANKYNKRLDRFVDMELSGVLKSVLPAFVTIVAFAAFNGTIMIFTNGHGFQEGMTALILRVILFFRFSELLEACVYILSVHVLWLLGIHGQNALFNIGDGMYARRLFENLSHVRVGMAPEAIMNTTFANAFVYLGGSGAILAMMIAVGIFGKDKRQRGIARVGFIPTILNVNEIILYGLPIVLNPTYVFPFLAAPLANLLLAYGATKMGMIPVICREMPWTTPIFISGYVATGTLAGSVFQLFLLLVDGLIYFPFIKLYEKEQIFSLGENTRKLSAVLQNAEEHNRQIDLMKLEGSLGATAYTLKSDLQDAVTVKSDELFLMYQSQYNTQEECIGAEALLRYRHTEIGYIYPPLIIKLAKENGFLTELEKLILGQACLCLNELKEQGRENYKISINLTGMSLESSEIEKNIQDALDQYQIDAKRLWIEITEQDALASTGEIVDKLRRLREKGHKLLIDDFGMGHTSIEYLQSNLFDAVKLDGSITRNVLSNKRNSEIISSITNMGNRLQLNIIAEYVEEEEQKERLKELGCECFQGYLYSEPVVKKKFLESQNVF